MLKKRVIYSCIHKRMYESSKQGYIYKDEFFRLLGIFYHIPKQLRNKVLKELKEMGIIEMPESKKDKLIKINPDFDSL